MPAFDLVIHTGAVLDAGFAGLRSTRAGRQLFWPNGQAGLWRKMGLNNVTEVPVVVDCEYPSFADYWATFTGGQGIVSGHLMALSDDVQGAMGAGNPHSSTRFEFTGKHLFGRSG